MKTITLAVAAMLSLTVLTTMSRSQTGDTAYEKKSYNYAEWAKGRFSEVVTVRNAGKIIYVAGVGAEDETSAQGGVIRHLGDFGAPRTTRSLAATRSTSPNSSSGMLPSSTTMKTGINPTGSATGRSTTIER